MNQMLRKASRFDMGENMFSCLDLMNWGILLETFFLNFYFLIKVVLNFLKFRYYKNGNNIYINCTLFENSFM